MSEHAHVSTVCKQAIALATIAGERNLVAELQLAQRALQVLQLIGVKLATVLLEDQPLLELAAPLQRDVGDHGEGTREQDCA